MATPTPPSSPSPLDRRSHISWFRILGPLPNLDMAEGKRVWHPFHQRVCAMRIVPCKTEEEQILLRRACQRLRRLAHPNVVPTLDLVSLEEGMGLIEDDDGGGLTLRQVLDEMGTLQLDEALNIFRQILDGVAGLHSAGLVHGDLHPGHVRLDEEEGQLHVRLRGVGPPLLGAATTDDRYLAPECISGGAPDHRTDVFALGVILYESLAGRVPFEAEDLWTRRKHIRSGELTPLQRLVPQLPMELGFAVSSALKGDPAQRFPDARAFARAMPRTVPGQEGVRPPAEYEDSIEPDMTEVIDVPNPSGAEEVSSHRVDLDSLSPPPPPSSPSPERRAADPAEGDAEDAEESIGAGDAVAPAAAPPSAADAIGDIDQKELEKYAEPEEPPPDERTQGPALGASSVDLFLHISKAVRVMAIPGLLLLLFVGFMSASGFQEAQDQERRLGQIEDALNQMMVGIEPLAREAIELGVEPNAVNPMLESYLAAHGQQERQRAAETMATGLLRLVRSLPETEDVQLRDRRRILERRINHLLGEIRNYKNGQSELESTSDAFFGAWLARFFR